MPCKVKLQDDTELNDAEFYNWVFENYDRLVEEGKIKPPRKYGFAKDVKDFINESIKKLGDILAAKDADPIKTKIDFLQNRAKTFIEELGIEITSPITKMISNIRTESQLAKLLEIGRAHV